MSNHRLTLRYAATWHLLAELLRRHHREHDLRLCWQFPGLSPNGIVELRRPSGAVLLSFDLVFSAVGPGAAHDIGDYVSALLGSDDPKQLVDRLELVAGLPAHPASLAHPSGAVQCARVIANLLTRRSFARVSYRTSPAYADNDASVRACDWLAHLPEVQAIVDAARTRAVEPFDEAPLVQHLFALHAGDLPLGYDRDGLPFVAFDLRAGVAHLLHRHGQRSTLALTNADAHGGRRLGELIDWIDASL